MEAASAVLLMCKIFYLNRRSDLSGYEEFVGILFLYVLLCSAKDYNWFPAFHSHLAVKQTRSSGRTLELMTLYLRFFFACFEKVFFILHSEMWNQERKDRDAFTVAFLQVLTFWINFIWNFFFLIIFIWNEVKFLK